MGTESNHGWWERLFRRGDWTQAETWYEQLGRDIEREASGPAGTPLEYVLSDEETDELITVKVVCTCDAVVYTINDENFYCLHCDRPCNLAQYGRCYRCAKYNDNIEYRLEEDDNGSELD